MEQYFNQLQEILEQARARISEVIIGQNDVINLTLLTIMTGQHALIEGVPGIGKTLLVRTLAKVLGCDFNRIQFTPDLMPSDITGTNIFNLQKQSFEIVKGPVFTEFLLADEINRAPAKTQSALLQAMQERLVSIDRTTHILSPHFTVFATQNPIEYEGTYPLPEAQKDRFMIVIPMGYPEQADEINLANHFLGTHTPESLIQEDHIQPIITRETLTAVKQTLLYVTIKPELVEYCVEIIRRTRLHQGVKTGAGPRGTQALLLASRALAIINNRTYITPDDIKDVTIPTTAHRLILRPEYEMEGLTCSDVLHSILNEVPVPK